METFFTILIIAVLVYYLLIHNKNKTQKRNYSTAPKRKSQSVKKDILKEDWIFNKEIDSPNIPEIINTYRKHISGYNFEKVKKSISVFKRIKNEINRSQSIIQLIEPMLELSKKDYLEDYEVDDLLFTVFTFLIEYYPIIGANGQLKNLEDLSKFFPESVIGDFDFKEAYLELKMRNEIITIIEKDGLLYQKDLVKIENFEKLNLQKYFMHRITELGVIKKEKKGKFVIFVI